MSERKARHRRLTVVAVVVTVLLALVGCGRDGAGAATLNLEGVSTTGDNPFSPAVGTDQAGVSPPANSGGTFPGNTVGLFGGTKNATSCDKAKLVEFLQQDRAKAVAWAGVLGIRVEDIQPFVASLTPAILRSDTTVTNHGFKDGKAIEIPAVLQAGTAVLVDVHGFPVTKCFCGNPLTAPAAFTNVTFRNQPWPNFSEQQITVIAPVTQTVQQFVFVQPGTTNSFQRPAGTTGQQDVPATSPAPTTFPSPTSVPPTAPATTGTTASAPPPGVVVPTPTPATSPPVVTRTPTPPAPPPPGSPTAPTSPSPTATGSPAPTATPPAPPPPGSPSATPPASPPPGSPTATPPVPPPPGSPTGSPTATPPGSPTASPSPTAPLRASWVVGNCFVKSGQAHGTVLVRPDGSSPHTFTVEVRLGRQSNPIAVETVRVSAAPGQIGQAEVTASTPTPDGSVQCGILSIVDETGATPLQGEPLPPPPETSPMPEQPGPGAPSGPAPPATPPPPVVPGGTPT
jgi:hypothetical protein